MPHNATVIDMVKQKLLLRSHYRSRHYGHHHYQAETPTPATIVYTELAYHTIYYKSHGAHGW